MIFQDAYGVIVRIPTDKMCCRILSDEALIWAIGDMDDDGKTVTYTVSREVAVKCMQETGDKEIEA